MRFFILLIGVILGGLGADAQDPIALVSISETTSKAVITKSVDIAITSTFNLLRGKIIVDLTVDGRPGQYLLDTGADELILNATLAGDDIFQARGYSSTSNAEKTLVKDLTWGSHRYQDLPAYKVDLSDLEENMGFSLAGIIGHRLLGEGALHIDYASKVLTFTESPKARDLKKAGWQAFHLYKVDHLLAVSLKINGQKVTMGLDTGAEINLLATSSNLDVMEKSQRSIVGIQAKQQIAKQVAISSIQLGKSDLDIGALYYCPSESFNQQFNGELSGLLGFPFFANNNFILDLSNKVLYLKN